MKLLQIKTKAGIYVICDWRTEFSFLSVIYWSVSVPIMEFLPFIKSYCSKNVLV